jgi:hypothetical protein
MANMEEKETVTKYVLELSETEAKALQHIIGVFCPKGVVGDLYRALDDVLGEPTLVLTTAYYGSIFENRVIEDEITYLLDEQAL